MVCDLLSPTWARRREDQGCRCAMRGGSPAARLASWRPAASTSQRCASVAASPSVDRSSAASSAADRLTDLQLEVQHLERRVRGIVVRGHAPRDALAQHRFGRRAFDQREACALVRGQGTHLVTLVPAQRSRIDDHVQAGAQHCARQRLQPRVGAHVHRLAVQAPCLRRRRPRGGGHAGQALALDVGADAHRAERRQQRQRHRALARARQAAGQHQPRRGRTQLRELAGDAQVVRQGASRLRPRGVAGLPGRRAGPPPARAPSRGTTAKKGSSARPP